MWNPNGGNIYNNPNNRNQPSMMMGAGGLYGQNPVNNYGNANPNPGFGTGFASPKGAFGQPNGGMMMNQGLYGGAMNANMNVNANKQQLPSSEKDRQIQQIKSMVANVQQKQVMNNNQPIDLVELNMQIEANGVFLQIPMTLVLDNRFPAYPPKIYIRSKLKHNLFELKGDIIELDPNNIVQWIPQQTTLADLLNKAKAIFQTDPPKQDKVIEDVNRLLGLVTEQNFKDLVSGDYFSHRSPEDHRQLNNVSSFQEFICSTPEYKKVANNLVDVINFNEKLSNELLEKRNNIEQRKQSLLMVTDTIDNLTKEHNDRVSKCRAFKDAFSKQNIEGFVNKEIKNLDNQSLNIESAAQNHHGNVQEIIQAYFDTRKNFHRLNTIKAKIPELKF